jgi:hypothetical protein
MKCKECNSENKEFRILAFRILVPYMKNGVASVSGALCNDCGYFQELGGGMGAFTARLTNKELQYIQKYNSPVPMWNINEGLLDSENFGEE